MMWQMPVPHQLNLTPQSRVAMLALGKLAVEAGNSDAYLVSANREPALTFNASCHARAVNREQRTRNRHKQADDRAVGIELMSARQLSAFVLGNIADLGGDCL
jgi:hypothetical protein